MNNLKVLASGIIKNNPTFVLVLGMCPTLGTTTSAENGFGMGVATMAVLILSAIVPAAARTVVLRLGRIELVQKGKSLHQQLRVVGQRVAAQRCHILCQPSCYHQCRRAAQLFLYALHHAVNEHRRAHHRAGKHTLFGIGADLSLIHI